MRIIIAHERNTIQIGRTSENDALTVRFDVRDWPELYGAGGSFVLVHQRPGDAQPYVCAASVALDGYLDWIVAAVDVEKIGAGEAQLTYVFGETIAKSVIFKTQIQRSLGQAGELPEPYEDKIDELIEAAGNITTDANRAEAARTGAETAQRKAEQAQTAAETAQRKAEQAQAGAEQAKRDTDAAAAAALESISSAKTAAVSDVGAAGDTAVLRVQQEGGAQVAAATQQAESAAASAGIATQKAGLAAGSASAAAADALKAEGFATGKQNGVDVPSGSPYYHNNAKYYNEQAAGSAQSAGDAKTAAQTAQGKAEEAQAAAENSAAQAAQSAAACATTSVSVTLTSDSWVNNRQTATVSGVLADETLQLIHIIPVDASKAAYVAAGVIGASQSSNAIVFECIHVPTVDLVVIVDITGVISDD